MPDDAAPRPDSFYGWSKAAVESLGRLYHERYGLTVVNLRIGWCSRHPYDRRGAEIWLSPDDVGRLVEAAIAPTVPASTPSGACPPNTDLVVVARRWRGDRLPAAGRLGGVCVEFADSRDVHPAALAQFMRRAECSVSADCADLVVRARTVHRLRADHSLCADPVRGARTFRTLRAGCNVRADHQPARDEPERSVSAEHIPFGRSSRGLRRPGSGRLGSRQLGTGTVSRALGGAGGAGQTRVGLTSASLASRPLTNAGESSVDRDRASSTASEIATAVGDVVVPDDLPRAEPQDRAVDAGHPRQRPARASTS